MVKLMPTHRRRRIHTQHPPLQQCHPNSNNQQSNWGLPYGTNRGAHASTGHGKNSKEPYTNISSGPLDVFMLFFAGATQLLVVETHSYYQQYFEKLEDGPSPLPDVTETGMFLFLTLALQMRDETD
jgi:hypothetical protein